MGGKKKKTKEENDSPKQTDDPIFPRSICLSERAFEICTAKSCIRERNFSLLCPCDFPSLPKSTRWKETAYHFNENTNRTGLRASHLFPWFFFFFIL